MGTTGIVIVCALVVAGLIGTGALRWFIHRHTAPRRLVKPCPNCGHTVLITYETCPKCGEPLPH